MFHCVRYIFGGGTALYVTDDPVVKPVVSVYPAVHTDHLKGKSALLCLASGMLPPLVRFSWKRQKTNGPLEDLPAAKGEQLELREQGRTAAIVIIHQQEATTYQYHCYVQHEADTVESQTAQEVPGATTASPATTATHPESEQEHPAALHPPDLTLQSECRVKLLCLLYTVLIVKSVVYCCGVSLLMILTNEQSSTRRTRAD